MESPTISVRWSVGPSYRAPSWFHNVITNWFAQLFCTGKVCVNAHAREAKHEVAQPRGSPGKFLAQGVDRRDGQEEPEGYCVPHPCRLSVLVAFSYIFRVSAVHLSTYKDFCVYWRKSQGIGLPFLFWCCKAVRARVARNLSRSSTVARADIAGAGPARTTTRTS